MNSEKPDVSRSYNIGAAFFCSKTHCSVPLSLYVQLSVKCGNRTHCAAAFGHNCMRKPDLLKCSMLGLAASKSAIRTEMKACLAQLSSEEVMLQSNRLLPHLLHLSSFTEAHGVSAYLSMKGEIDTYGMIKQLIEEHNKKVFIPKVMGKNSDDMAMIPLNSYEDIEKFPKNKWGIPEPVLSNQDSLSISQLSEIDLVLLPGVAFDRLGGRLGHGKGYYDSFVRRLTAARQSVGKGAPCLVGIALKEQILDSIPMEPHDQRLSFLLTCDGLIDCHRPSAT